MRILLTGHDGYLGTALGPTLQDAGHDAVGLDAGLFSACEFGRQPPAPPSRRGDVRDVRIMDVAGFDAVVHLAGLPDDASGTLGPALTDRVNAAASVRLATLAREAGVRRFVFASSCEVYGAVGGDAVTEDVRLDPATAYGRAKARAEVGIRALASDAFSPVCLRLASVYGLSPRMRFDLAVNHLTARAVTTGGVRLAHGEALWQPLVHVADVCRAVLAVLEAPREAVHDQAFNVGREGESHQIQDVARIVGEEVAGCHVAVADGAAPDACSYRVSFAKIAEHLPGWRPAWTVRDGVREVRDALADRGLCPAVFEGPRYGRVAHLRSRIGSGALDADLRWTALVDGSSARRVLAARGALRSS